MRIFAESLTRERVSDPNFAYESTKIAISECPATFLAVFLDSDAILRGFAAGGGEQIKLHSGNVDFALKSITRFNIFVNSLGGVLERGGRQVPPLMISQKC